MSGAQVRATAAEARGTRGIDDMQHREEWLSGYERLVAIWRWVFGFGLPSMLFVAGIALLVLPMRGSMR